MMVYHRRRMSRGFSRRPINSVKNDTDSFQIGLAVNAATDVTLAATTNDYTGGITQVPIGAVIKAIYLEVSMASRATTVEVIDWIIGKVSSGLTTLPQANLVGGSPVRKWVFEHHADLVGQQDGGTIRYKKWIKIPPKMQRMGEGDLIQVKAFNRTGTSWDFGVHFIYKFYQ